MPMTPPTRKLALTAHIVASVGWLGAVISSLALAIVGLTSRDPEVVRSVYVTMKVTGWYILVPFSIASLLTGVIQSLGTRWGLFRHYWVIVKLVINVVASVILVLYMQTLYALARDVRSPALSPQSLGQLGRPSPVAHGVGALLLLVGATILSVDKPRGMTKRWRRKQAELTKT